MALLYNIIWFICRDNDSVIYWKVSIELSLYIINKYHRLPLFK